MPYVKPISGHTSCRFVQEYLEKGARALARDFINLEERDAEGRSWSRQMDDVRAIAGNDVSLNGGKVRTYNHYVLSPDPKDCPTLEELRGYATEWAERAFPGFQVAVVYHDDSKERLASGKEGVLHAHLVVNNTNLDTGRRLAPYLTASKVREISKLAQDMARERGWHAFEPQETSEEREAEFRGFSLDGRTKGDAKQLRHPWHTRQGARYSKTEREILASGGWSWKEDLRCRIRIAKELSCTEGEFSRALTMMGVKIERSAKGDYLYTHPERETWKATGMKLGRAFSRDGVRSALADEDTRRAIPGISGRRADILTALDSYRITGMRSIGWLHADGKTTLRDVADALEVNREFRIGRTEDYAIRLAELKPGSDGAERLMRAREVVATIHAKKYAPKARAGRVVERPDVGFDAMSDAEAARAIAKRYRELGADSGARRQMIAQKDSGAARQRTQEEQSNAQKRRQASERASLGRDGARRE